MSLNILLMGLIIAVLFASIHLVFVLADAARSEDD